MTLRKSVKEIKKYIEKEMGMEVELGLTIKPKARRKNANRKIRVYST